MTEFSLRTLGGLSLLKGGEPVTGPAGQRKRLLLLALVAGYNQGAGISRDRVLGLLWPESDEMRARNSLNQSLFGLRRDLVDAVTGALDLRFDAALIECDVVELWRASERNDLEGVVEHYAGPFLDGVFADGGELNAWIERMRSAVDDVFRAALQSLARRADSDRDTSTAVKYWSRLASVVPYDASVACSLMRARVANDDRTGALAHARAYALAVRKEFEIEPDATVAALAGQLAAENERGAGVIGRNGPRLITLPTPLRDASAVVVPVDTLSVTSVRRNAIPRWRRYEVIAGAAVVIVAVVMFITLMKVPRAAALEQTRSERLLVVPVEQKATHGTDRLSEMATSMLAVALEGTPHLEVVDPVAVLTTVSHAVVSDQEAATLAQHFDAGRFVREAVAIAGARLTLRATLFDSRTPTSSLLSVAVEGSTDSLQTVTDRLAAEFLAARYPATRNHLVQAAARSTPSLDAFKAYLTGDDAMNQKRFTAAVAAYQRAVKVDSMFALAYYGLSIAADWAPNGNTVLEAADKAVSTSGRLDVHERLLVQALRAWRHDDFDQAERLYRRLADTWRDDLEAHFGLAEVLFHGNPARGRSFLESEPEFIQILSAEPYNDEARLHLARIAAWFGDRGRADSLLRPVIASRPDSQSLELRTFRAAVLGNRTEFSGLVTEFENRDDVTVLTACTRVAVWARDLQGAEQICRLLTSPRRSPVSRTVGRLHLAELAMAGGDRVRARLELAQVPDVGRLRALALGAWIETLPDIPVDRRSAAAVREELTRWDPTAAKTTDDRFPALGRGQVSLRHYYLALLDGALGDDVSASGETRALVQPPIDPVDTLKRMSLRSLSARVALSNGRTADALSLSVSPYRPTVGDAFANVSDRFVRAMALKATGHQQDALDGYGSFDGAYISDLVLAAPAHLRRAAMFEADRRVDEARREYDVALALWRRPDSTLQVVRGTALRKRAALGEK